MSRIIALIVAFDAGALLLSGCLIGQGPAGPAGLAAESDHTSLPVQLAAGEAYLAAGQPNDAFVVYRRAVSMDITSYEAQLGLAKACAELGELRTGLNAAEAAADIHPEDPHPLLTAGRTCLAAQDLERAESYLKEAVALDGSLAEAWRDIGEARFLQESFRPAVAALERARDLSPQDADIWGKLGAAYDASGQPGSAVAAYRKAVELDPANPLYPRTLAWMLIMQEDADLTEARELALRSDELERGDGDALVAAAVALLYQGHIDDGIAELGTCLEKVPDNGDSYVFLAEGLIRRGRPDDLQQAVQALEAVQARALPVRPANEARVGRLIEAIREGVAHYRSLAASQAAEQ